MPREEEIREQISFRLGFWKLVNASWILPLKFGFWLYLLILKSSQILGVVRKINQPAGIPRGHSNERIRHEWRWHKNVRFPCAIPRSLASIFTLEESILLAIQLVWWISKGQSTSIIANSNEKHNFPNLAFGNLANRRFHQFKWFVFYGSAHELWNYFRIYPRAIKLQ